MSTLIKPFVQLIHSFDIVWKSLGKHVDKSTANLLVVVFAMLFVFVTMLYSLVIAAIIIIKLLF